MIQVSPKAVLLLAATSALLGLTPLRTADSAPAADCVLEYQRADNMWAPEGRPDGNLGIETITLSAGGYKTLNTDWKYEKMRNDGRTYYGSHLRVARNKGTRYIRLRVVADALSGPVPVHIDPGQQKNFKHDLGSVQCLET